MHLRSKIRWALYEVNMNIYRTLSPALLAAVLSASSFAYAMPQDQTAPAPDNSGVNKQHKVTADKQTTGADDRETARKIRKSVVADKSLSTYGHNVKIIVLNGQVTLKGPVNSEDEKKKIGDLAAQVAGSADKVTNNITVKASS